MEDIPNEFDLDSLLRHWSIHEPWQVQPTSAGASNRSFFVTTLSESYVLRISRERTLAGLTYEHAVLSWLSQVELPFRIPVPVPTADGATYMPVSPANEYACLVRRLPGVPPQQTKNLRQAQFAGEALGRLVLALSQCRSLPGQPRFPRYGELRDYLPHAYSPPAAIAAARALDAEVKRALTTVVERVDAALPNLYGTLPQQLLHRDYFASNVLMSGDVVAAVLDFDFAGEDVRALDFAIGLTWWALELDCLDDWEVLEAFGRGYIQGGGPFTEAEARALPTLGMLRLVTGVMWSLGRFLSNVDTDDGLYVFLSNRALAFAAWSGQHGEELVERATQWVTRTN